MTISNQQLINTLTTIRKSLENLKAESLEIKGQQNALMNQLKEQFDCTSIEEAQELFSQLEAETKDWEKKLKEDTDNLMEELVTEGLINEN